MYEALSILRYPIGWCLDGLTALFNHIGILVAVGTYGLAIICTTLIIRALLFPLFGWQLRSQRRTQREQRIVAPQLAELRKKYRKDPRTLQTEMQKVYSEHGISPMSGLTGCLPILVQAPVLIGLYTAIRSGASHLTEDKNFLWVRDVSQSVHDLCCPTFVGSGTFTDIFRWIGETLVGMLSHPTLAIIPLIAAGATFIQSRMMLPPIREDMTPQEKSMAGMSRNLSFLAPVSVLLFSLNFAQGLPLYWATSTLFMLGQQYYSVGWGSLNVPTWFPGHGRVTPLSHPVASTTVVSGGADGGGRNGKAPAGPAPSGRGRSPRAVRERVAAEPVAPGKGRAPARSSSSKKRRRR